MSRHQETALCVDLSNQVYKAVAAYAGLTSGNTFTGGLYGFLLGVSRAIEEVGADRLIVGADTKPYIRAKEFPDYKGNRPSLQKEMTEEDRLVLMARKQSLSLVEGLLNAIGIPVWRVAGFEYDDLVAHVVRKYRCRFAAVVAHSSDSDLYQLFYARNFYLHRGKKGFYLRSNFRSDWKDTSPQDFIKALALMGTHNAVPGVHGIGPATAAKAVSDPKTWATYYAKHKAIVDRNLPLIELPHRKFPYEETLPVNVPVRDPVRELYKYCGRYDIDVTRAMANAVEQVCRT